MHACRSTLEDPTTRDAAGLLCWESQLGSLEAGKRADLLVCQGNSADPYEQLIFAKESDLSLVMINGVGRVGTTALMRRLGLAGETLKLDGATRTLYFAHPNADPLVQGLTLAQAREALAGALRSLPALARRAERPQPVSEAARTRAGGTTWRLALDEVVDTGVDVRPNLPANGDGRTLRAAARMRPLFSAAPRKLSASVMPLSIDALTVVDDDAYLDGLDQQRNLPADIKAGLRGLWT